MYILTNDRYPIEAQRNKKIHVPRSVAEVAIYRGEATLAPRPAYGTPAWIEEQQERDANRPLIAGDAVPSIVAGTEWACLDKAPGSIMSCVRIVKRCGAETTYFSSPPADAPPSIVARFKALTSTIDPEAFREQEAQERNNRQQQQAAQKRAECVGVASLIYGK